MIVSGIVIATSFFVLAKQGHCGSEGNPCGGTIYTNLAAMIITPSLALFILALLYYLLSLSMSRFAVGAAMTWVMFAALLILDAPPDQYCEPLLGGLGGPCWGKAFAAAITAVILLVGGVVYGMSQWLRIRSAEKGK